MVENLKWVREEGRKHYQGWLVNPCHTRCGGRKKSLLLAKECFDLLETIATRKTIFEKFCFLQGSGYKLRGEQADTSQQEQERKQEEFLLYLVNPLLLSLVLPLVSLS